MKDCYYSIDDKRFLGDRDIVLQIGGWCLFADGTVPQIRVLDENNREIPFELIRVERADVTENIRALKGFDRNCGFRLMFHDPEKTVLCGKTISVYAIAKEKTKKIWSCSASALGRLREEYWIQYGIDAVSRSEKNARIDGWAVVQGGLEQIGICGPDGRELPADIRLRKRIDVERSLHSDPNGTPGFEIRLDAEKLPENEVFLILAGGGRTKKIKVSLSGDQKKQSYLRQRIFQPLYWKRGLHFLKRNGFRAALHRVLHGPADLTVDYNKWFYEHRASAETLEAQRNTEKNLAFRPKISIAVPAYNTKIPFLEALLASVTEQSYTNWELCIADGSTNTDVEKYITQAMGDDARIKYCRLEKNLGIAGNTNFAINMAEGDFIMLTDHDDLLERNALFEIVRRLNEEPDLDIIYTDEDLTDVSGEKYFSPRFKPDYNPDFLTSINYICHIFVVRAEIMKAVGGFREEFDGAQDWDMILRCCEQTERIGHIPQVLYHWRAHEESTAGNPESKQYAIAAGKRAVEEHFRRIGQNAVVEETNIFILFRIRMIPQTEPKISIVICNKDQKNVLKACMDSIYQKSSYRNFEVIIVENNSTRQETFRYYEELQREHSNVRIVVYETDGPFNYAALNNYGVSFASGDYCILLNNDTKVITEDWIERMLGFCQRENTGIVGAKLYYEDMTVQHCGVVLGLGGFAGHVQTLQMRGDAGYFGRLQAVQDASAVTAACLMIKKSVFDQIGGFDERLGVALNDVDLCLKVRREGLLVVLDPSTELYHLESKSRGSEESAEKHERFKREIRYFREKWKDELEKGDPYYNPNLTLTLGDCSIRREDEHFDIVEEIEQDIRKEQAGEAAVK